MSTTKILSASALAAERDRLAAAGRRLVLTNGVFDLLHVGHVRYLQGARSLGDALAIAVNADASVRALKGPTRPLNAQDDRAEVLAALACVDYVVIFDQVRATDLIAEVRPMIYAKGGDYTLSSLDAGERAALEACGAEIHLVPLVPGKSTTGLVERIKG